MPPQTADRIEEVTRFIENAHKELEQGIAVDLKNFQQEVANLCKDMNNMPAVEAQIYFDKMERFQDALQVFEVALRQQKAEVEYKIKMLNKQKSANTAYVKTDKSS